MPQPHQDSLLSSSDEEKRLYELIWQQFIGSQLPDAEYLATNAKIHLEEYIFSATGREVVFDGYTKIVKPKSDDPDALILPALTNGQILYLNELDNKQKYTKPPARFSEAALVKELEKKGIGRPQPMPILFQLSKIVVMLMLRIEGSLLKRLE